LRSSRRGSNCCYGDNATTGADMLPRCVVAGLAAAARVSLLAICEIPAVSDGETS
jgi:hypothetical protein